MINFGENNFNENIRTNIKGNKSVKKAETKKKSSIEVKNEL